VLSLPREATPLIGAIGGRRDISPIAGAIGLDLIQADTLWSAIHH
jgi:hypothetical protein